MGFRETALALSPLAYYGLADATDEVASSDLSPNGTGTFSADGYWPGSGRYGNITGSNDYLIKNPSGWSTPESTIVAVCTPSDVSPALAFIVSHCSTEFSDGVWLAFSSGNIVTGADSVVVTYDPVISVSDDNTYLIVMRVSDANDVTSVWRGAVGGEAWTKFEGASAAAISWTSAKFKLAGQVKTADRATRWLRGTIDEVGLYDSALSDEDIDSLWAAFSASNDAGGGGGDGGPGSFGRGDYATPVPFMSRADWKKYRMFTPYQ